YQREDEKATDYIFPLLSNDAEYAGYVTQADKDRMRPELRHKMYQDISSKNALINKYLKKIAEKAEIEKPLSMHISRHSFAHIAQESGAESSAIKNILGHSNLATTERYMGSFDTSKTDETLRNVFAKKQSSATATEESGATKEEQAIELLKSMTPEQIMAVISAINK
ncbi:tyrosine-type recombinase/integrase, partial [uncultured Duncaniella sp.]